MRNVSFRDTSGTQFNEVNAKNIDTRANLIYFEDPNTGATRRTELPSYETKRLSAIVPSRFHPVFGNRND